MSDPHVRVRIVKRPGLFGYHVSVTCGVMESTDYCLTRRGAKRSAIRMVGYYQRTAHPDVTDEWTAQL